MTVVGRKLPACVGNGSSSAQRLHSNFPGDVPANAVLSFQETRYRDGGAHWYRSSAVLLRYHKLVKTLVAASLWFAQVTNLVCVAIKRADTSIEYYIITWVFIVDSKTNNSNICSR